MAAAAPPLAFYDAHTHLCNFGDDLPSILTAARAAGVTRFAVCGTREADWPRVAALAAAHPALVSPSYGIHPWHTGDVASGWVDRLEARLVSDPRAGVGESGLDRAPRGEAAAPPDVQRALTAEHVRLAVQHGRPLTLHCVRSAGALADILETHASPSGYPAGAVIHAWRGGHDRAARFLALGGVHLSLGARSVVGVAPGTMSWLPLDRVLLESDADARHRKTVSSVHNEYVSVPADLPAVAAAVAAAVGVEVDVLVAAATANARRVFG